MVSRKSDEIGTLYGIRALMTVMVAQYHFWQQSWMTENYVLNSTGYLYVDGFILLSGFLLFLPYERDRSRVFDRAETKRFYLRRFLRIYPSYFLAVLGSLLLTLLLDGRYGGIWTIILDTVSHLSFTQMFFRFTYVISPLNGALWTVCVEVLLYLLFPLIVSCERKKPALTYAVLLTIGIGYRVAVLLFVSDPTLWMNQAIGYLDVFALGMLLSKTYVCLERKWKDKNLLSLFAIGLSVVSAVAVFSLQNRQTGFAISGILQRGQMMTRLPFSLSIGLFMLCTSLWPRIPRVLLDNELTRCIAFVSMNLYFWHQLLAVLLKRFYYPDTEILHQTLTLQQSYTLLCWSVSLLCALTLTYFVEKPTGGFLQKHFDSQEISLFHSTDKRIE